MALRIGLHTPSVILISSRHESEAAFHPSAAYDGVMRARLLVLILAAGCGSNSAPPASSPGTTSAGAISGLERVGWDQSADGATALGGYRFAIYVDGARSELSAVLCDTETTTQVFACSGKGPDLAPGSHTLEISAFNASGESARSAALTVTVARTAETASVEWPSELAGSDPAEPPLRLEKLVSGLDHPTDAVFLPDGRLLIGEATGVVRIIAGDQLQADALTSADDADTPGAVLSLAVDPGFAQTRFVFVVQAARSSRGDVFRLARYREVNGILAQRAVLLEIESPALDDAAAVLRIAPDGTLLLAAGAPCCPGVLLRLNADGTTPRDQAGSTPVIAQWLQSPRGLALDPRTGMIWLADAPDHQGRLTGVALAGRPQRPSVRVRQELSGSGPLAFIGVNGVAAFRNTLLLASPLERHIKRIRFDATAPERIDAIDTLLQDAVGDIRVVVAGPDGAVYFCTADALGRLREPDPAGLSASARR